LNVSVGLKVVDFHVSGNFPKIAWRVFKAARQPIFFVLFWVPGEETAWRRIPGRQATHGRSSFFLGWDEVPGGG